MIASERSLASAHQSQSQQRPTTISKARNGAAKPPVRPVKIYVIDPRKLQQRLEAYVDQKNQKRTEAEIEKAKQDKEKQQQNKVEINNHNSPTGKLTLPVATSSVKSVNSITKPPPPAKLLPALAPKLPSTTLPPANNSTTANGLNQHQNGTTLGNGVTLQSLTLPCINGAGLSLPALPLVVTNGVAIIQPPNSQSSIPTSGLFLPGITAIPSVISNDGAMNGPPQQQQRQSKAGVTQKRKAKKKKKAAKKRKTTDKKEEDDDDRELSYLLKETTTRLGRISRPVSQPHSPPLTTPLSATNSRAPSPKSSLKKKVVGKDKKVFQCKTCVQVFENADSLQIHLEEVPLHRMGNTTAVDESLKEKFASTNSNVQGPVTLSPISSPFSNMGSTSTKPITITQQSTIGTSLLAREPANTLTKSLQSSDNMKMMTPLGNFNQLSNSQTSAPRVSHEISRTCIFSAPTTTTSNYIDQQSIITSYASIGNDTELNVSLVPTTEEHNGLFRRCMTSSSSVVQVPTSFSMPSSPPSRCQSPRPSDDIFNGTNLLGKGMISSPRAVCNSPVDPMLLHSRSPFPPPIPENSSHSINASNLSIPEESLCKGELFMDLGDGVLENSNLSRISPTPFGDEPPIGQLFVDSDMQEQDGTQDSVIPTEETHPVDDIEQRDSNSATGPSKIAPMLLETTTEDANDGEIFQTANYTRTFLHPSVLSSTNMTSVDALNMVGEERNLSGRYANCASELPRTPQSAYLESDVSMDSSETNEMANLTNQKCRSIWQFVKDQIKFRGINQACGEISEMADKLSRIARDHFIPIREEEVERLGNSSSIIHVDTPFFSHLLDLPFGMYIFKEDAGTRKKIPPPPPMTSSELSFTCGVDDVEKFLPPDIDLISLPHLTNLDLT